MNCRKRNFVTHDFINEKNKVTMTSNASRDRSNEQLGVNKMSITHKLHDDDNNRKIRRKCLKRNIQYTKRVTFATKVTYINGYAPYESGRTDADILKLYRDDIWYTKKDYSSFMQDRIDTIRVYHSVNGDMSGLHEYYCIEGLERVLHRAPATTPFSSNHKFRTQSLDETKQFELKKEKSSLGHSSYLNDESSSRCNDESNASDATRTTSLTLSSLRKKIYPVDVNSLRTMNIQLLSRINKPNPLSMMCQSTRLDETVPISFMNDCYNMKSLSTMNSMRNKNIQVNSKLFEAINHVLDITSEYMNQSANSTDTSLNCNLE